MQSLYCLVANWDFMTPQKLERYCEICNAAGRVGNVSTDSTIMRCLRRGWTFNDPK